MSNLRGTPTLVDRGQALGMRLITRVGGLSAMANPAVKARVERALYRSAKQGFAAQTMAGRAFKKKPSVGAPTRPQPRTAKREFDLTPSPDQAMIRAAARELATEAFRPSAARADTERAVPGEVRDRAAQLGMTLLGIPSELGGVADEASAVTGVLVMEELAYGDLGLAAAIMSSAAVANAIALYGDSAQQQTFLAPFTDEHSPATGAIAIMEPQPLFDPFRPQTRAKKSGDGYSLTGIKSLVAAADSADLFVVSALLEGEPRLFIVEPGAPGFTTSDDPAMGVRAAHTMRLHLADVHVPADHLLGTTQDHRDAVRRGRLAWAAAAVGTARAVLDQLTSYTTERTAFGEPIAYRQAVAFTVADIAIELDGLRLVVWRAAALLDDGKDASAQIAHARDLAARYGTEIGSDGVQLLGGHGFVKEFDNERWYRDLRATGVLEGMLLV